jgi:hypothetical protein
MGSQTLREFISTQVPQLRETGINLADARMTAYLAAAIVWLDQLVFGEDGSIPIVPVLNSQEDDPFSVVASFVVPQSNSGAYYMIFSKGIAKEIIDSSRNTQFFASREDGAVHILPHTESHPKIRETIFGMAAHEVRHRIQYSDNPPDIFRPHIRPKTGYFIDLMWQVENHQRTLQIQKLLAEGMDPDLIAHQASDVEFDARIVQRAAEHYFHAITSEQHALRILLMDTR